MKAFEVADYSIEEFISIIAAASSSPEDKVAAKQHINYFSNYFAALQARTIVVEYDYIDHDFLEDYAAYYVRCFEPYQKLTRRVHFFTTHFTGEDFEHFLSKEETGLTIDILQNSYVGFVVLKHLPNTVVGRTCLKTYGSDDGRREFPILREYKANLFGTTLKIETLAFQEQDTVVAACATSALWSCFQGTGKLFQHAIPSPVEITKAATEHIPENIPAVNTRPFPNDGLTAAQMAISVREVGLEPFVIGAKKHHILKSTLYAYLKAKMPSILAVGLCDEDAKGEDILPIGGHAIAVTGFSLGHDSPVPEPNSGFLLKSSRIDKIYAHDDQIGPFARMECSSENGREFLDTTYYSRREKVTAEPHFLLIPLYHKIRIPFEVIHDAILQVDNLISIALEHIGEERIEWDIYLTNVNDYKEQVVKNYPNTLIGSSLLEQATQKLPKFIWRVSAYLDGNLELDILFDATGIAQHSLIKNMIFTSERLYDVFHMFGEQFSEHCTSLQAKSVFEKAVEIEK